MLEQLSKNLTPRLFTMLLIAIVALTVSTAYSSLARTTLKEHKQLKSQYTQLHKQSSNPQITANKIDNLKQEIAQLDQQLAKTGLQVTKENQIPKTISELSEYAKKHQVQMLNVTPGETEKDDTYNETPFTLQLSGEYFQLFKWIYDLEHANSPLIVKSFSLKPGETSQLRLLDLKIGLFQPSTDPS